MNHTDAEARAIWADQDSMPDVLNQEPQSVCTVEDFDVIKPNMYTILPPESMKRSTSSH